MEMSDSPAVHRHLDEDQIDELARMILDGSKEPASPIEFECAECEARVDAHGRYLSLARLLTRDTRAPSGTPAVEAVRGIRRQSYRRRALRELATLVTSPLKTGG